MEKRILILEDEIIVAIDLQEVLEGVGYSTYVAHTYKDAMTAVASFKPQLAICDINLGIGENGIDFAKDVNKLSPQMEIIYVTAFSDSKMVTEAIETEPFNYLVKPWNEQQIAVTVNMAFTYIMERMKNDSLVKNLSLSEYKILDLIAKQKKSKEIAEILFIAEKTVRNHRYNIIKKLDLPNDNNSLLKWAITHFNK